MRSKLYLLITIPLVFMGMSCNKPVSPDPVTEESQPAIEGPQPDQPEEDDDFQPGQIPYSGLIQPDDLEYVGFFRLPEPSGGSDWDYSGHGLTYFPDGDPEGASDGFPGSLFTHVSIN